MSTRFLLATIAILGLGVTIAFSQVSAPASAGEELSFSDRPELTLAEGVKKHKGIDAIYAEFSRGYRELNPGVVANLYAADGSYLPPGRGVVDGRDEILKNFSGFFKRVDARGQAMQISFEILKRDVRKKMGYDVGIYTLRYIGDGKLTGESKGKFVVVATKEDDGKWYFAIDVYNDMRD